MIDVNYTENKRSSWILFTPVGIFIFIILYFIATQLYPGGSQADKYSKGFSWMDNYWCNLLNEHAINGEPNASRPVALAASLILAFSVSVFWYFFPLYTSFKKSARIILQWSGIVAMLLAIFLFTGFHDAIINIAGFLGIVSLSGTVIALYKRKFYMLFGWVLFNFLLIALNNYVYFSGSLMNYLPIIQKISFLSFLLWFSCVAVRISKYK